MTNVTNMAMFGKSDSSESKEAVASIPLLRILNRAVVLHTLCDPSLRDPDVDKDIIDNLRNKDDYFVAPRNSIVCRITTEKRGKVENSDYVCFPFFSSHIMMPVKGGEQVWIINEQPGSNFERPYWLSRIPGPIHVEDVNFTHLDRRFQKNTPKGDNESDLDDGSGNFLQKRKLTFQNGNPDIPELSTLKGDQTAFEDVIKKSKERKYIFFEPVPRYTKRPGDLVLQGSNNTCISLGTSSGWDFQNRPSENEKNSVSFSETKEQVGSIDIVVGRGKIYQDYSKEKSLAKNKSTKNSTRPIVEENTQGFETDKNVSTQQSQEDSKKLGNTKTNPQEGDPDLVLDDSRIFVTSEINVDESFGTGQEGVAKKFDNQVQNHTGPSIVVKSDHIRIVAKKKKIKKSEQKEPDDIQSKKSTKSTIRIIKEGNHTEDLASIILEDDGTIQISGSKIFFGRAADDGGKGDGDKSAPSNSQPYVKYQQLEDLLTQTFDDLSNFVQKLQINFNANTTPGFGGPNPALIKSAEDECIEFLDAIKKRKSEIVKIKSERIFGE